MYFNTVGENLTIHAGTDCQSPAQESVQFDVVKIYLFYADPSKFPKCKGDDISKDDFIIETLPPGYEDEVVVDGLNTSSMGSKTAYATLWGKPVPAKTANYTVICCVDEDCDECENCEDGTCECAEVTSISGIWGDYWEGDSDTAIAEGDIPPDCPIEWGGPESVSISGNGTTATVTFDTYTEYSRINAKTSCQGTAVVSDYFNVMCQNCYEFVGVQPNTISPCPDCNLASGNCETDAYWIKESHPKFTGQTPSYPDIGYCYYTTKTEEVGVHTYCVPSELTDASAIAACAALVGMTVADCGQCIYVGDVVSCGLCLADLIGGGFDCVDPEHCFYVEGCGYCPEGDDRCEFPIEEKKVVDPEGNRLCFPGIDWEDPI